MTITREDRLASLTIIGGIGARTLEAMRTDARPGMTTAELDAIGAEMLARELPLKLAYDFRVAACMSIFTSIAQGVSNSQVLAAGQIVNIDLPAEMDSSFADRLKLTIQYEHSAVATPRGAVIATLTA